MLKKITIILGVLIFFGVIFLAPSSQTFAQVVVADVNIYNSKIISQDNNTVVIGFDIFNRTGIQPDIRYSIQLVKIDEQNNGGAVADTYIYPEIVNLGENMTVHKQVSYSIPPGLRGKYEVWVISQNSSGLMLGLGRAGIVTLVGNSAATIEILSETCSLAVQEDKSKARYSLLQGVDISSSESLIITCAIRNGFDKSIKVTPKFGTFYRNVFGKEVEQTGGATSSVALKSGDNKLMSFILPKATNPQAYDVKFRLATEDGKTVSNTIIAHYVLQGASATIQNITLDKDIYYKGDTAKLMVFWSGSADGFMGSRVGTSTAIELPRFDIRINNFKGELCGELLNYQPISSVDKDIIVPIQRDCISPQVTFVLSSKSVQDGAPLLVQSDFKITTDESRLPLPETFSKKISWFVLIFSVLISIIVGIILYKKKKKSSSSLPLSLFFIIFSAGILIALPNQAEALTLTYDVIFKSGYGWEQLTHPNFVINLDKSSYKPGESINVSISANDGICNNRGVNLRTYGRIDNISYNAVQPANRWGGSGSGYNIDVYDKILFSGNDGSSVNSAGVAPPENGMHTLWITNLHGVDGGCEWRGRCLKRIEWHRLYSDQQNAAYIGGIYRIPFEVTGQNIDIGLRIYNGSEVVKIAAETSSSKSNLRIAKGGKAYGISLVDKGDPEGSKVLIKTSSGVKELREYTGADGIYVPVSASCNYINTTEDPSGSAYITWGTNVSGGNGSYSYHWLQNNPPLYNPFPDAVLTRDGESSATYFYTTKGEKTTSVEITSGAGWWDKTTVACPAVTLN